MTTICPVQLRQLYQQGRVLPFVGAGASMSVTWSESGATRRGPSWDELVDHAVSLLGFDDPKLLSLRGSHLQILEYFRLKRGNFAEITNWLYARMRPTEADLEKSPIHTALARLQKCGVFYTTNYDDFLERTLTIHRRAPKVVRAERDMGRQDTTVTEVVKFHGDFNSPNEMVLSESHYQDRLRMETPLDLKLRSDVLGRAVLFLGYSFRDPNVAYLFHGVNSLFGALPGSYTGKRAYIVVPNPSDFEMQLFHSRNIEVIPTYEADRATGLVKLLEELEA